MDSSRIEVSACPTEHVPHIWMQLEPLIEKALFYASGEYTIPDIYNAVITNKMQLWIALEDRALTGMIVTEFLRFPQMFVCQAVLLAGTAFDRWEHISSEVESWAAEVGASKMRTFARPGWKKKAKEHGYELKYCVYEKPLEGDHAHTH